MLFTTLLSAALAIAAASAQTPSLTTLLNTTSDLSALNNLLGQFPQFAAAVANRTNITLFAPSNEALTALTQSGALTGASQTFIQDVLSYHIVNSTIYASAIGTTPAFVHTNLIDPTFTNVTNGQVVEARLVNGTAELISGLGNISKVTQANLNFTGGVVHIIDQVLTIPPNVSSTAIAANLTALVGLLGATSLDSAVEAIHDVTVFAPSNSAFQAIASAAGGLNVSQLATIAEYHVINGTVAYSTSLKNETVASLTGNLTITILNGSVFVNQARVITADVLVAGGVLHIIDSVLNPGNANATANATEVGGVVGFPGASSGSSVPLTSGVPSPSGTASALVGTTPAVAAGYPTASAAGGAGGAANGSSSVAGAAHAMATGAIGVAVLFGGAAAMAANL